MTLDTDDIGRSHQRAIVWAGVSGALFVYTAFMAIAASRAGWVFEYPLDDVYIHLAIAEQIAGGGYGVNPGENASAASSPLYPFLLTPYAGTALHRWMPLAWNLAGLVIAAALFAQAMAWAGLARSGVILAALAPFALAIYVTAFTGMENVLHVAANMLIVLGLWRFVETGSLWWGLFLGVVLASALRFEGLAMGMASGSVVLLLGRPIAGLALIAATVTPPLVFAGFLMAQGLDPVPSSVVAKLGDVQGGGPLGRLMLNASAYGGRYLLGLSVVLMLLGLAVLRRNRRRAYFALAIGGSGLAHLAFGSVGWMDRYETYATVACVAAIALVLKGFAPPTGTIGVALALAGGVATYAPYALSVYAWNPTAIAQQQGEMARFAKEFVKAPIAVNDIGYVAWRNPDYVLDLWGLASAEALQARRTATEPGWAGALAEDKGTTLAMVYDEWFEDAVPPDWMRLGVLQLAIPTAFLGGREVAFYATSPEYADELRAHISAWEKSLPPRATFQPAVTRP